MFKRFALFALTNIVVIATVSVVLNLLGVQPYMTAYGINYESLMIFCAIWGMAGSFISLAMSKFMAKTMMGVKIVDSMPEYTGLVSKIHRMARSAGLSKMPEVGIYDSPEINAFATGPSKNNSLVAVSTGLLHNMNDGEVEGVLGHEVAHIANGDMVTMTLIQGVVNAFVMFFARIAAFAVSQFLRGDEEEGQGLGMFAHMAVVFLFEILFGIAGMVITSWFSRFREFRADYGGAQLAGRENMIAALKRLEVVHDRAYFDKRAEGMNSLKISSKEGGLKALLSTHPKLSDRIRRLETNS